MEILWSGFNTRVWLGHRPKMFFSSEHSVGKVKDGEPLACHTTTITWHESSGTCCSTLDAEIFLYYHDKFTCSRVSCFEIVSFSIFLIFFMSLLTWNSCSCSKCCSNSAFSCWSWDWKKKEEDRAGTEENKRWENRERSKSTRRGSRWVT